MKKLILFIMCSFSSFAWSADHYKYGIDILTASSDLACDHVKEVVINPLWATSCKDTSTGFRLSYAMEVKPSYFIELSYAEMGDVEWKGHFTGFDNGEPQTVIDRKTVKFGATAWEVIARKDFELSQSVNFQLLAGVAFSKGTFKSSEYRENTEVPGSGWTEKFSASDNNTSPILGFGLSYKRIVLAYKIHKDVGSGESGETDISSLNLGIRI